MSIVGWTRFWLEKDKPYYTESTGFLANPKGFSGSLWNAHLKAMEDLDQCSCLILLGEPGMGKTTEMKRYRRKLESSGEGVVWIDNQLSLENLASDLRDSGHDLDRNVTVLVDSLDEYSCGIVQSVKVIRDCIINAVKHSREVSFILACRTGDWSDILVGILSEAYDKLNGAHDREIGIYELTVLSLEDVRSLLNEWDVDEKGFLEAAKASDLWSFLTRPLTLVMLVEQYRRNNMEAFKKGRMGLFEACCRKLCEIPEEGASAERRMAIASRIAFFTEFSGRGIIVDESENALRNNMVSVSQLAGICETKRGDVFIATEAQIKEVLKTALFSVSHEGTIWSHRSYAEFLAASFIVSRNLSEMQLRSLIMHNYRPEDLVPQLKETIAWIATERDEIFDYLLEISPLTLLSSDLSVTEDRKKKILVTKLLELYDKEIYNERITDLSGNLRYAGIENDLLDYIKNKEKNIPSRVLALRIAESCRTDAIEDEIMNVLLDEKEHISVRKYAASFFICSPNKDQKTKLLPFVLEDIPTDKDDEIKGLCMYALWPEHISVSKLLSSITPKKDNRLIGAYDAFIETVLFEKIDRSSSIEALDWYVKHFSDDSYPNYLLPKLLSKVTEERIYYKEMAAKIASLLILLYGSKSSLINEEAFRAFRTKLLRNHEMLLDVFKNIVTTEEEDGLLIKIILRFVLDEESVYNDLLKLPEIDERPQVSQTLRKRLTQIREHSSGKTMGISHRPEEPSLAQQAKKIIRENGSREIRALIDLLHREIGLSSLWGFWKGEILSDLSKDERDDLIRIVKEFVSDSSCVSRKGSRASRYTLDDIAVIFSLLNLEMFDSNWLAENSSILKKYLDIILSFQLVEKEPRLLLQTLVKRGMDLFTKESLKILERMILEQTSEDKWFDLSRFSGLNIEGISGLLFEASKNMDLSARFRRNAIEFLLNEDKNRAMKFIYDQISNAGMDELPIPLPDLCLLLLEHSEGKEWDRVWEIVETNQQQEEFLITIARDNDRYRILNRLDHLQMESLYRALLNSFPKLLNSDFDSGEYTTHNHLLQLKYDIEKSLEELASFKAVETLERLSKEYPTLKWRYSSAYDLALKSNWIPAKIDTLTALIENQKRRIVRNSDEFLAVVLEALDELNKALVSESLPRAIDLWNECKVNSVTKYRPKDENRVSDYVTRFLRSYLIERGIVINREVQIRRDNKRQFADIHLTAVEDSASSMSSKIELVIEVKGNWHPQIDEAMKRQLLDQYMKKNSINIGIYLVSWFNYENWDREDPRRSDALRKNENKKQALEKYNEQARRLSDNTFKVKPYVLDISLGGSQD
ncbi:NACHT domain-containing NTPase [Mesotoga sp.]|uniref:NACHT domain-containing protein n=1 Tax=Mesotoga sp. TaxID=2053577 RepID=UPI00345E8D85